MKNYIKTLSAELTKIKGTKILFLGYLLGALLPFILFIMDLFSDETMTELVNPGTLFIKLEFDKTLQALTGFFLPVLIIINASKITQLDHKNRGWSLMETQPVNKLSIYLAKYSIIVWNVLKAILVYTIAVIAFCWLRLAFMDIDENYSFAIAYEHIAYVISRVFIAALAVTALQYILSLLIPNFIWSLILGFGLLLSHIFLDDLDVNLRWHPYRPLLYAGKYPSGGQLGNYFLPSEYLSIVYTIALLIFGYYWYKAKGIFNAFLKSPKRIILSLLFIGVIATISYPFIKTKTLEPFSKTVIKGTINSDQEVNTVLILDPITQDTLMHIPVVQNVFRFEYDKELKPNRYTLRIEEYFQKSIFLATQDSIQIKYTRKNKKNNLTTSGTRIVENQQDYYTSRFNYYSYKLENNMNLEDYEMYDESILKTYNNDLEEIESKVNEDNITVRQDFIEISKKLVAVEHATGWRNYLKKQKLYRPDVQVSTSPEMKELLATVDLENESLLMNPNYVNYINEILKEKEADSTKTSLDLISSLEPSSFKDKWLYSSLTASLSDATENGQRDSLYHKFEPYITNVRLKELALQEKRKLNKLNKGQPAIEIELKKPNGDLAKLSDFRGSFIMIDTWASWCAPCKYQEPFYIQKQKKYKDENIIFMSINVDRNENAWHEDLPEMSKDITQLRAIHLEKYMRDYGIQSIPRFMLIDPQGHILSTQFIAPSNKNFDDLLEAQLSKKSSSTSS